MSVFLYLVFIFFLFQPLAVQGVSLNVVINEIAWMGTEVNSSDEWIELYNNTNQDINLDGWGLYEKGGETLIEPLTETIKAKSYYLIERTDNETVPDIEASQPPTSWGGHGLKNTGEHLQLLDNNSNIVDEVDCEEGWFAGKAKPEYKTMERTDSGWQTSQNPEGTPKSENSTSPEKLPETGSPATEEEKTEPAETGSPAAEPVSYPAGVVFSEILPSPEGPDAKNEWIVPTNRQKYSVFL